MRSYNQKGSLCLRHAVAAIGFVAANGALCAEISTAAGGIVVVSAELAVIEGFSIPLSNGVMAMHDIGPIEFATATLHTGGRFEYSGSSARPAIQACGDIKTASSAGVIENFSLSALGGCTANN